jgi:hypothetical protein
MVGVNISRDTPPSAQNFFEVGQQYSYQATGGDIAFTVEGVYEDAAAAMRLHKGLSSQWYTLSPYEIMNLGSGPWTSAER